MTRRATIFAAFVLPCFLVACDLSRPWQPTRAAASAEDIQAAQIKAKEDQAIGVYNQIPVTLGDPEQNFLRQLALTLPRGAEFRTWASSKEPQRIERLGLRSLGLASRRDAELLLGTYLANLGVGVEHWEIARSARYTPASWDYDLRFSPKAEKGLAAREINRLLGELGNTALQGNVYLDATVFESGRIFASLRDRRVRTSSEQEAAILEQLRRVYRGFDVKFTARDVLVDERLKQRIYDIMIEGDFRGLSAEVPDNQPLRFSPDDGPQENPAPADNDANRRLIERENGKFR